MLFEAIAIAIMLILYTLIVLESDFFRTLFGYALSSLLIAFGFQIKILEISFLGLLLFIITLSHHIEQIVERRREKKQLEEKEK